MVSTKDDVKKEAEVLYKMQHTFTHVGFVERIVAIAETYAQQRLLQQTPCSTQLPPTLLSEDEFGKLRAASPSDKFRSAQFKKGMYAGYLETLDLLRRQLR